MIKYTNINTIAIVMMLKIIIVGSQVDVSAIIITSCAKSFSEGNVSGGGI